MEERITWIDSVKGLAMFSVVLCHVVNGYSASGVFADSNALLYGIQNIANSFQMPLFCIVSGFLFYKAYMDKEGNIKKDRIKRHIYDLISTYVLWCLIMGGFKILLSRQVNNEVTVKDLLLIWCRPIGVYWYLYVLIFLYLIFMSKKIKGMKDKYQFIIFSVAGVVGSIMTDDFLEGCFFIRRILYYLPVFFLGIMLSKGYLKNLKKRMEIVVGIYSVLLIIIFWNSDLEIYHIPFVNLLVAIGMSVFIICLFNRITTLGSLKFLSVLGKNSLEIYILHVFFTAGSRMVIEKLNLTNVYICILCTLVTSLFLPIVIGLVARKIGVYAWIFKPYSAIYTIRHKRLKE